MGKRSNLPSNRPKDFWGTIDPQSIPQTLVNKLMGKTYAEPCYGEGDLEDQLMGIANCGWRSDVRKTVGCSKVMDATKLRAVDVAHCDVIVTNPPFSWDLLKPLLDHLPTVLPTWLLLPADVMHNVRMGPYMKQCSDVISVGRLYWMENKVRGVDNYAWFCFRNDIQDTKFFGR